MVTNRDLSGMFSVSRQAMLKEITKLVEINIIESVGKGRGAYYKLRSAKEFLFLYVQ